MNSMYSPIRPKERNVILYANEKLDSHLKPQSSGDKKILTPLANATKVYLNL